MRDLKSDVETTIRYMYRIALDSCGVYRYEDGEYQAPDPEEEDRIVKYFQDMIDHDFECWDGYDKEWVKELVHKRIIEHRTYDKERIRNEWEAIRECELIYASLHGVHFDDLN